MCKICVNTPCICPSPHSIVLDIFDAVLRRDDAAMHAALELERKLRDKYPDRLWCWAFTDARDVIQMRIAQRKSSEFASTYQLSAKKVV